MKIAISIAVSDGSKGLSDTIRSIEENSEDYLDDIELIVSNLRTNSDTKPFKCLDDTGLSGYTVISYGTDIGLSKAHNSALAIADCDYFVVASPGLVISDRGWLSRSIASFESEPKVGAVGLPFSGGVSRNLMMASTEFLMISGLFDPDCEGWEDLEFSLRVSQMGYKVKTIDIKYSGDSKLHREESNRRVVEKRWKTTEVKRPFVNRVLVKFPKDASTAIACTPVLGVVQRNHPSASVDVFASAGTIFDSNPVVKETLTPNFQNNTLYDRIVDISGIDKAKEALPVDQALCIVGSSERALSPELFLNAVELDEGNTKIWSDWWGGEGSTSVGISLQIPEGNKNGVGWSYDYTKTLIGMLVESGLNVVELGGKVQSTGLASVDLVGRLSVREAMSVVANLDLLICVDSLPFYLATAFGTMTYVLLGASSPLSRIPDFTHVVPITEDALPCIGCLHRNSGRGCSIGYPVCMTNITPEQVYNTIMSGFEAGLISNLKYMRR